MAAPTASPCICARIAGTSRTLMSDGSGKRRRSSSTWKWRRPTRWSASPARPGRNGHAGAGRRHEVTTEGGLDIVGQEARLKDVIARLRDAGITTSVFIDAEIPQIEAAARIGASVCEIHTGPYAHAFYEKGRDAEAPAVLAELEKIRAAGRAIRQLGMRFKRRPRAQLLQRPAGRQAGWHPRTSHRPCHSSAAPSLSACARRCAR